MLLREFGPCCKRQDTDLDNAESLQHVVQFLLRTNGDNVVVYPIVPAALLSYDITAEKSYRRTQKDGLNDPARDLSCRFMCGKVQYKISHVASPWHDLVHSSFIPSILAYLIALVQYVNGDEKKWNMRLSRRPSNQGMPTSAEVPVSKINKGGKI